MPHATGQDVAHARVPVQRLLGKLYVRQDTPGVIERSREDPSVVLIDGDHLDDPLRFVEQRAERRQLTGEVEQRVVAATERPPCAGR